MKKIATQTVITMQNGSTIICNSHKDVEALKGEEVISILTTETFKGTPSEKAKMLEELKQ